MLPWRDGLTPAHAMLLLEIAVLALLAAQLARLAWAVVTPMTPLGAWQPATAPPPAVDRSLLSGFDPFFRQAPDGGSTQVSSLALTLLGTRVDIVSGRGSAIIAAPDGSQQSFLVGETIVPGVRLKSVQFDGVTLDRGGAVEALFLDQSSSPATRAPPPAATDDRRGLAAEMAIVPRLNGTTVTGYVLSPRGRGTAFAAAGLVPGDVLTGIDGTPVADITDPAGLALRIETRGANVAIDRAGVPMTLHIGPAR